MKRQALFPPKITDGIYKIRTVPKPGKLSSNVFSKKPQPNMKKPRKRYTSSKTVLQNSSKRF
jgi:hypothetical protein